MTIRQEVESILNQLGVPIQTQGTLAVRSPITGEIIAQLPTTTAAEATKAIAQAHAAFLEWRTVPAPKRGELVRLLGEELRANIDPLGRLVTIETGKLLSEGHGEVQEMIDICTFAAGLSRQLAGLTVPSERSKHRMMETWHPLGVVGIISAFNFPVAVWSWNAALALVCGNAIVWKPSEKTPLTALATQAIFECAAKKFGDVPKGLATLLIGDATVGQQLVDSPLIPLVSATGSTAMGRAVAPKLAARFARAILELGGNNAAIVAPTADLDLTLRAIAFSAMGTAGQRCTTLRRLIVHDSIYDKLIPQLKRVYASVVIGDSREPSTLVGPLIDERAFNAMQKALIQAGKDGATITGGERIFPVNDDEEDIGSELRTQEFLKNNPEIDETIIRDAEYHASYTRGVFENCPEAFYVRPALVEIPTQTDPVPDIVKHETFAPILYILKYKNFEDALRLHNDVPQGLSSSIFTMNLREAEQFLSATGSDCGIANVNIGTSGAEIGGAFGGEKETGGGRESGSDAWKAYMRRATNTINYGSDLPLAQGVSFDID
jgi:aldehyde dehydrogenase (NAD+)